MATIDKERVILASTSAYRRELLRRIIADFDVADPAVDESAMSGESPRSRAARLAREKTRAVAATRDGLIIGSDQVAELDGEIIGKPGSATSAERQLLNFRSREVRFLTAVCLSTGRDLPPIEHLDETVVSFRAFDPALAKRYVAWDTPYDCAGGFKVESAGPVLFNQVRSEDPTALIGLPLIWLAQTLEACGKELL